jgi:hypothetical protein
MKKRATQTPAGKFNIRIKLHGKYYWLGTYETESQALEVYKQALLTTSSILDGTSALLKRNKPKYIYRRGNSYRVFQRNKHIATCKTLAEAQELLKKINENA